MLELIILQLTGNTGRERWRYDDETANVVVE